MKTTTEKLPVALALCEQLISISLGNYEGPGSPEEALALLERIIERSDFTPEDGELLESKLNMAREVVPKPATVHQLKQKPKPPTSDGNPYRHRFGIKG